MIEVSWKKDEGKSEYYHGTTNTKFSAQIGKSTEPNEFVWMIFHEESKICQDGGSSESVENAMELASTWLSENQKWKIQN